MKPSPSQRKAWPRLEGFRWKRKVAPVSITPAKACDTSSTQEHNLHHIFCRQSKRDEDQQDSSQPARSLISDPDVGAAQTGSQGHTGAESWSDPVEYLTKHPFFMSTSSTSSDDEVLHHTEGCVDVDDVSLSIGSVGSLLCSNQASIDNIALGINRPGASTDTLVGDLVLSGSAEEPSAEPVIVEPMDMDLTNPALDGQDGLHQLAQSLLSLYGEIVCCGRRSFKE